MSGANVETSPVDAVVMCAVALLFQKTVGRNMVQKVRSCFVVHCEGDDEYEHKAKAERYFREHDEFGKELDGFHICAWHTAMLNEAT